MTDVKYDSGTAPQDDVWLDVDEARNRLRVLIADFMRDSTDGLIAGREKAPSLALKVSAGLGKTRTALECLASQADAFLEHGNILFYVPTLDLAVEAEAAFRALRSGYPSMVLRGRSALNPETGVPMCARSSLAEALSKSVTSVTAALCRAETPDGTTVQAPCAAACPYLEQGHDQSHRVIFLSHAYLVSNPPVQGPVALRIIDEKFWAELVDIRDVPLDDWYFTPEHMTNAGLETLYREASKTISGALEARQPVHPALRTAKISKSMLQRLAQVEERSASGLRVQPHHSDTQIRQAIETFERRHSEGSRVRAIIFRLLAETWDQNGTDRLSIVRAQSAAARRALLKVHHVSPLPSDAPMLLLDADLDEIIVRCVCPDIQVERILARPNATVVQVSDKTLSTTSLLREKDSAERRSDVARIIKREVARAAGKGVLVVATKGVLEALVEDSGGTFDGSATEHKLHGAVARWFGARLLGVNTYARFGTVILVGRRQVPVHAVEDNLRALFGDSAAPITFTDGNNLVVSSRDIRGSDDARIPVRTRVHPDPRGTALLSQDREALSEQAVARLRLVSTDAPKRVIILSNVPLPGLPVDDLRTFAAVVADRTDEQVSGKYRKLEKLVQGQAELSLFGLRLSAAGLCADGPQVFPSRTAASEFRRGLATEELLRWIVEIATAENIAVSRLKLSRGTRGGKPTTAVVFSKPEQALSIARQLWPNLHVSPLVECLTPGSPALEQVLEPF